MADKLPEWQQQPALRRYNDTRRQRTVTKTHRKVRQLPQLPFEYWMDADGNVVPLCVATTRNLQEAVNWQAYGDNERRIKLRQGWVPWEWREARRYSSMSSPDYRIGQADIATEEAWHKKRGELQATLRKDYADRNSGVSAWLDEARTRKLETKEAISDFVKEFTEVVRASSEKKAK